MLKTCGPKCREPEADRQNENTRCEEGIKPGEQNTNLLEHTEDTELTEGRHRELTLQMEAQTNSYRESYINKGSDQDRGETGNFRNRATIKLKS